MGKNINVDQRCDMAGAYEIVSDCFRVVIIEENNEIFFFLSLLSGTKIRNEFNQVPRLYFFHAQLRLCLNFDTE